MPAALPQAARDALEGLLDGERSSMIAELRAELPVISRASEHMRELLLGLAGDRRQRETQLLAALGLESARKSASPRTATDPFLPLLSLRFVLLKAHEALTLLLRRYANSTDQVRGSVVAAQLVESHHQQLQAALERLSRELTAMGLEPAPEP